MHYALVLEAYYSLPLIPPDPDGGGVALPVPVEPSLTWTIAHAPEGDRLPFVVRHTGTEVVDRPVRRFWRDHAARTECEVLNRAAARERDLARDVVVMVAPAPQPRQGTTRVENPHTVTRPSPWNSRETMDHYRTDAVEIDGRMHRVGVRSATPTGRVRPRSTSAPSAPSTGPPPPAGAGR